jgi:hypothetical protein
MPLFSPFQLTPLSDFTDYYFAWRGFFLEKPPLVMDKG